VRRRQAHHRVVALGPGVGIGEQVAVLDLEVGHAGFQLGDREFERGVPVVVGCCKRHRLSGHGVAIYYGSLSRWRDEGRAT
jgi:hypothetical protein